MLQVVNTQHIAEFDVPASILYVEPNSDCDVHDLYIVHPTHTLWVHCTHKYTSIRSNTVE